MGQIVGDFPRRYFRVGLISGIVALGFALVAQAALLFELSVFNTAIGLWLLLLRFVLYTGAALVAAVTLTVGVGLIRSR